MPATVPNQQNDFSGIAREVLAPLTQTQFPESLFHYTTSEGVFGLLTSDALWLTDTRFMNDTSEGVYGLGLAIRLIREFLADKPNAAHLGERVIGALRQTAQLQFTAASCFCRQSDLLTQWRAYGGSSVPYCVEFETAGLFKHANFQPALLKVVYDEQQQRGLLAQAIEKVYAQAMALASDYPDMPEDQVETRVVQAASEISQILYWLKHPAFSSEDEYRLSLELGYLINIGLKQQVRPSAFGFVPYFAWAPNDKRLPIKSIMVGPTPHRDYAQVGLKAFIETTKYFPEIRINAPSAIPLR